jgi:uncharacterized protein (DUF1330 family)
MNIDLQELAALAQKIGAILERHGLRYHLTGGVVASHYGESRNTQDVDIVVEMDACKDQQSLFQELKKEFYVDQGAFDEAIQMKSMFQVLDIDSMLRADIYTTSVLPSRFERVVKTEIVDGVSLPIASPEDAILSKLHWIKLGSGRSRQDVVAMLRVQENLDNDYLETTAEQLDVKPILDELRKIAESYDPHIIL